MLRAGVRACKPAAWVVAMVSPPTHRLARRKTHRIPTIGRKMTLQELTDAHVRALLDPDGCDPSDWRELVPTGLARVYWAEPDERNLCKHTRGLTEAGDRIIAEAQRIADGLSVFQRETLQACVREDCIGWGVELPVLRALRLIFEDDQPTPAGRLVLALRERSR